MSNGAAPTRRANKVADWIEASALIRGVALGGDALKQIGASVGYQEADVALGLTTMQRRSTLLGAAYPFRVGGGAAALADAADHVWTSLLLMSPEAPTRGSIDIATAATHLERVTAAALGNLYGPGTQAIRFAWPSEDGRPPEFPDAIRWLTERMSVPIGRAYRPPYAKDGGVDVIAWRPFPDGRSGFPVLLAQCTLEKDYWHKAADIEVRIWSGWLALDVDPATALAVPDVVASGEEWNALAARTIVLDRIRLASLLAADGPTDGRLGVVSQWTNDQVAAIREVE